MFGAGRVAVMWCCAIMIPEEGLDLLTACLQTGRKTFAAAVPPLAIQFNSSHSYPFPLLRRNNWPPQKPIPVLKL